MNTILNMSTFAQGIIGLIVLLFFLTIVYSFVIKKTHRNLLKDITNKENRSNHLFKYKMHNDMIDDFNGAIRNNVDEVNTLAIIEKNMAIHMKGVHFGERLVKKSVALMIVLGLLGTFYGLILSIDELVAMLGDSQQADSIESITSGLISSITGMSVAFITSMFGIGASILTNITSVFFGLAEAKENVIVATEEYLDNNLMVSTSGFKAIDEEGNTALSLSLDRFSTSFTHQLKGLSQEISDNLSASTGDLVLTAESVKSSVVKFDHSLNQFSENIRDFTEFNHHLRANIQRLNVGLDNFSDHIESKADIQEKNNHKMDQLTQSLDQLKHKDR